MPRKSRVYDAIIVGAGFSGLSCLHEFRKIGLKSKIFESGSGIGGVWYWNCYPGLRVDTEFHVYQFHQDDIAKDFPWTQRFPSGQELQKYFKHVDDQKKFSKDIQFNTSVTAAKFDNTKSKWEIKTSDGFTTLAQYFVLCTGYASKSYTPNIPGLDQFKGPCYHTSRWPRGKEINFEGKRVAVIGTGASGVQVIQEIGPQVKHLTVYQRTPNLSNPMVQVNRDDQSKWIFPSPEETQFKIEQNLNTFAGVGVQFIPREWSKDSSEERHEVFENLFTKGGFTFTMGNYVEIFFNPSANESVYKFWRDKTRARIQDPVKQELLAPMVAPHAFATKRPSMESTYFEVFNQTNVDIIDIRKSPILEITDKGIKTKIEGELEVDIIILATGFDSVTGGLLDIDITNGGGEKLGDKWKTGVCTQLGIATHGFPNMFFIYGPQAPTGLANGPTAAKIQVDWLVELLAQMKQRENSKIEATKAAEDVWRQTVLEAWNASLFVHTDSWYQGSNIPGKMKEPLNFLGGLPAYRQALKSCAASNYEGFKFDSRL